MLQLVAVEVEGLERAEPRHLGGQLAARQVLAAVELISSPEWLKSLRFNYTMVQWWNKNAGDIFEERGLNLYELIAQSFGECWDEEDEQKCAHAKEENVLPPCVKRKDNKPRHEDAIRLDHPRQVGVRKQQEEEGCELHVRHGNEGRQSDVQALRSGREELYRRAGGTSP